MYDLINIKARKDVKIISIVIMLLIILALLINFVVIKNKRNEDTKIGDNKVLQVASEAFEVQKNSTNQDEQ